MNLTETLQGFAIIVLFKDLAKKLGISYNQDRETDGEYPEEYLSVPATLAEVRKPVSMWYHTRSLSLVIEDINGKKVGVPLEDLREGGSIQLMSGLIKLHESYN